MLPSFLRLNEARRAARTPSHTVRMLIGEAMHQAGYNSVSESYQLQDYAAQTAYSFLREWAQEHKIDPVPEEVEYAVRDRVWENVSRSMWEHENHALVRAIKDILADGARAVVKSPIADVAIDGDGLIFTVYPPFLHLYRHALEGFGFPHDPEMRLKDVTARSVVGTAVTWAEVRGIASVRRRIEITLDEFEPDMGDYYRLAIVAERAMKK